MTRRTRTRQRQKQINILHTNMRQRHTNKQLVQMAGWCGLVLAMVILISVALHFGINFALNQVLFHNARYDLTRIEIEPRGHFTERVIRQAAGLDLGQNLWSLSLPQISRDLERLPYVSSAKVERHFPNKVAIYIQERVPVVKIVGINSDLNTRELFYLDRQAVVLKPREDEAAPLLPEIIGLSDSELNPGERLDQPGLARAMEILDAIDHSKLHTAIDISTINLTDPLSITMTTTRDMTITFQLDCIDQQLMRLKYIFDRADSMQRTLHTVDLTPMCNVPVTFYE